MIDAKQLLSDLQKLLNRLERDIQGRCESNRDIDAHLRSEYGKAKAANRTAHAFEVWREDYITQVAVAWILACVFVRFLEDNHLIDTAWLAGPKDRLQLARDQHTLYFQANPTHSDREYLEYVFRELAKLPSMHELLASDHNPISKLGPTGDGAHDLLDFWQSVEPSTGVIVHDFTDPELNTRFLGDLYQDLSGSARERFALLQTPEFVEEFILDRTLSPAIEEFGYSTVKMIDPACGSGHFLLGAFRRLLEIRMRHEPGIAVRAQVEATLNQVFGVDVNPFAVAIAQFRLLIAALKMTGSRQLSDAPAFHISVATGDSLLHGPSPKGFVGVQRTLTDDPLRHSYDIEDAEHVQSFLNQKYHVVVGNPPYITVKDEALNQAYRTRFRSCHMKYSLAVPFKERFFDLALHPDGNEISPAGFVGMITANSFMKREFGKKLIEEFIPTWDITEVIDTSGAYIPGHGTPTVILIGRHRRPLLATVRAVMGIRGEPTTPSSPVNGLVWNAILAAIENRQPDGEFVSMADSPREVFHRHPWTLGGGGISELKETLDKKREKVLGTLARAIGPMAITGMDEVFVAEPHLWRRLKIPCRSYLIGGSIRDWTVDLSASILSPYDNNLDVRPLADLEGAAQYLWPYRTHLRHRTLFGKTADEAALCWYSYRYLEKERARSLPLIAFAFVATHNFFVLLHERYVANQHAPVIALRDETPQPFYYLLIAFLNSSVSCFWMKQVSHNKGATSDTGVLQGDPEKFRFEFDSTKLNKLPIPKLSEAHSMALENLGRAMDAIGWELSSFDFQKLIDESVSRGKPIRIAFIEASEARDRLRRKLAWMQEEIDWVVYDAFGLLEGFTGFHHNCSLLPEDIPELDPEQRIFRQLDGQSVPVETVDLVRLKAIRGCHAVNLIERPEYKRRWFRSAGAYDDQNVSDDLLFERALRAWLRGRIEGLPLWASGQLSSCGFVADALRSDVAFLMAAEAFRARADFDLIALVRELIEPESIPLVTVLRLTESGRTTRGSWELTWEMQRREDAVDAEIRADQEIPEILKADVAEKRKAQQIGEVPVPRKYEVKDYMSQSFWSLRGKLDLPKERFISFPFCERDADPTPVIGWAGWNHLQQAQAIAAYYERVKNYEGWTPERRVPLLTGILELLPWLKQWHNNIHPEYQERMGDFFQQFVEDEACAMETTVDEIRKWAPPLQSKARGRKKKNT